MIDDEPNNDEPNTAVGDARRQPSLPESRRGREAAGEATSKERLFCSQPLKPPVFKVDLFPSHTPLMFLLWVHYCKNGNPRTLICAVQG